MRWLLSGGLAPLTLAALAGLVAFAAGSGWLGRIEFPGEIAPTPRPPAEVARRAAVRRRAAAIALAHGGSVLTLDSGFARFRGVRSENPQSQWADLKGAHGNEKLRFRHVR